MAEEFVKDSVLVWKVGCPSCGAKANEACKWATGFDSGQVQKRGFHQARNDRARAEFEKAKSA